MKWALRFFMPLANATRAMALTHEVTTAGPRRDVAAV